jgi:hypothetical protein
MKVVDIVDIKATSNAFANLRQFRVIDYLTSHDYIGKPETLIGSSDFYCLSVVYKEGARGVI